MGLSRSKLHEYFLGQPPMQHLAKGLRVNARRVAKGLYWLATPWRMPERLKSVLKHARRAAREATLRKLLAGPRERMRQRLGGEPAAAEPKVDLQDDASAASVAQCDFEAIYWPGLAPAEIIDRWSAARWCIDLLRARDDIRKRFPTALSSRRAGAFCAWLEREGESALGLGALARQHVLALFKQPPSDRARQVYLSSVAVREAFPHGLTPIGQATLWRWFFTFAPSDRALRPEEIWWLFLEAAEDPARELARAYLFTPSWQQAYPDALTVFGREAFAQWFARAFRAEGPWVLACNWPEQAPALELRTAYWARESWRAAHPRALAEVDAAARLIRWLATDAPHISASARAWCRRLEERSVAEALVAPGVNVLGHFCYPSGLRVSVESMVEALRLSGVQCSLRDVRTDEQDDPHHGDFDGLETFEVTIIHTQPTPFFNDAYQLADLCERSPRTYRIAYWYWELDTIPETWVTLAQQVDEVWAATEFVARGLRSRLSIPVRTLFPGVQLPAYERRERSHFGLSNERYTFLFTFHMMSVMERKNPLGLIRAFKRAFGPHEDAELVLKTSFGERYPAQLAELRAAAAGANVRIIDAVYSYDEVLSLMDVCDAYVSLHRAEGLGLTIAEGMLMGKPVIATRYSGNEAFMNAGNSLPVDYELQPVGRDIPPYDACSLWASPSEKHAARLMRQLYEDPALGRELGARARIDAGERLSLDAAGQRIAQRLREIARTAA